MIQLIIISALAQVATSASFFQNKQNKIASIMIYSFVLITNNFNCAQKLIIYKIPLLYKILIKKYDINLLQMFFEKFDNCRGYKNLTSRLKNINIRNLNNMMLMDYETHILVNSVGPLEWVWEIERCSSRENLNTCSLFTKVQSKKFCSFLQSQNEAWTPMMDCIKPKMSCPLIKGVYYGKNCTINTGAFRFFPIQGAYWKIKALVLENKMIRMCIDLSVGVKEI